MRKVALLLLAAATLSACWGRPFQSFFSSGEQYLAAGQYPEAVIQFQNAARVDPASSAAQMKLGESYAALRQPVNAAAAYERACALDVGNTAACLEAAAQFLALGEYDGAGALARTVLAADRFNLDAELILASSLAGVRRFADAEERIAAALAAAPDNPRAYRTLGEVQWQRGNAAAAEASLLKSIDLAPAAAGARVTLAQVYFDTDRAVDGERQLRFALDANPKDLAANQLYASYLVEADQCADAEPYWLNVAAESPDGSGALALADYYMFSGRPDDALRVLQPLTLERDEGGPARSRVAAILYDRGDRVKAAQIVDDLMAQDSTSVDVLVLKSRLALGDRDIARAREYAHRAAAMAPRAAAVRDVLAEIDSDR
jgi:Tfp pilus assembly protein PilF